MKVTTIFCWIFRGRWLDLMLRNFDQSGNKDLFLIGIVVHSELAKNSLWTPGIPGNTRNSNLILFSLENQDFVDHQIFFPNQILFTFFSTPQNQLWLREFLLLAMSARIFHPSLEIPKTKLFKSKLLTKNTMPKLQFDFFGQNFQFLGFH